MSKKEKTLERSDIKAFLGPGSQFEGTLVFDEVVRLDGVFRGEVTSKDTLIVGESADIQAEVDVGTFILSGRFKGNVKAASRVELRAPAKVDGTIDTPVLLVEEGVVFNGNLSMGAAKSGAAEKPAKAAVE